ncbi:DNA primase [Ktedonospora formicarum]|uniref:DNA primase n=1 Tax=Ktedonospora formicarum TaxID=2778364 RepID=A0A8J3I2G0_9CHLR|nr:DNA primase [Ktedonospora formicarum]GHO44254.1 hypothetical protein KSX_24170 [Ktedonospora formicarum]
MSSIIETIKAKVDIVEEISLIVTLQKSGKSLKGLCPFHNERTPSFYVYPETQTWHCFGCNEGGDIFSFVEKQQGQEFREALEYLSQKAGVQLEELQGRDSEAARETSAAKERLRQLNEDALLWFHHMLLRSREAEDARTYVQSRGISTDTVLTFGLGYAPEQWDSLSRYLLSRGYSERELVIGGLARERELGTADRGDERGIYDYFRNRLIFPIRDTRGHVIGFGGRALGESKPKYLNSPQTVLFEKNNVLYALDMARDAIKQTRQVVIVEGYVDAIIAHQYGTRQTVACIGSAITERHIQQLKKLTKQVTLALDPDEAGNAATEHGIQEALKGFDRTVVPVPLPASTSDRQWQQKGNGSKGVKERSGGYTGKQQQARGIIRLEEQVDAEINVLQLPPGEDPDEFIRRDHAAWLYAVTHPLPLVDYFFVSKTADLNVHEPTGKTEAARRLLPVIAMISDRIKRDAYMRKLASLISIGERSLYAELQRVLRDQRATSVTATFSAPLDRRNADREVASGRGNLGVISGSQESSDVNQTSSVEAKGVRTNGLVHTRHHGTSGILDRGEANRLKWEDYLIGLLLQNPGLSPYVYGIIDDGDFAGTDTRELYHILCAVYQQRASSPSLQSFEQYVPASLWDAFTRARASVDRETSRDGAILVKEAVQCATRLKRARLVQLNTELQFLIREATAAGDIHSRRQLQQKLLEIHRQLHTIDSATHLQG